MIKTMKTLIKHKAILYAFLTIVFLSVLVIFYFNQDSGLAQNFLVSGVEVFITVGIIDILISASNSNVRNDKYILINKPTVESVKFVCAQNIYLLGKLIKYDFLDNEKTIEFFDYNNSNLRSLSDKILASDKFKQLVEKSKTNIIFGTNKAKVLEKHIAEGLKRVDDVLKDIQPYIDPLLKERITKSKIEFTVQFSLINDIGNMFVKIEKEVDDPKGDALGKKLIWEPLIKGEIHGEEKGFENVIARYSKLLLHIHSLAESNKVHYEIE